MENNTTGSITEGLQKLASMSVKSLRSSFENMSGNISELGNLMKTMTPGTKASGSCKDHSDCCPPKQTCPPHCLTEITRHAYAGERIIVPFMIKNSCHGLKTYKVGVRQLKNIDGTTAPTQPVLNKGQVTLDMGQSEVVLMGINLLGFNAGSTFKAEIVIREKDYNQNICFTLMVDNYDNVPVAEPVDEKMYRLHWQSWQSHFYCEKPKGSRLTISGGQ